MFLHIGGEYTVLDRSIIGIFDFDASTHSDSSTIELLKKADAEQLLEYVSPDIPRSFILTEDRIYVSPVSAATLKLRLSDRYGIHGMIEENEEV